jgi:hypothetical protein
MRSSRQIYIKRGKRNTGMNVGEKIKEVDNEARGDTRVNLEDAVKFTLEQATKP